MSHENEIMFHVEKQGLEQRIVLEDTKENESTKCNQQAAEDKWEIQEIINAQEVS